MDFNEAMRRLRTAQGETPESVARMSTALRGLGASLVASPGTCIRHPHPVPPEFFAGGSPLPCPVCGISVPEGWEVVNGQAVALARETAFTYADWLAALTRIRDRPDKEKLIPVIRDAACMQRWKPDWVAIGLVGHGEGYPPGLLDWHPAREGGQQ